MGKINQIIILNDTQVEGPFQVSRSTLTKIKTLLHEEQLPEGTKQHTFGFEDSVDSKKQITNSLSQEDKEYDFVTK